jgi:tetratricopeptide (TPR) repeat protein
MYNLATVLTKRGNHQEALALLLENRAVRSKVYPPGHPRTMRLLVHLAGAYADVGQPAKTIELLEEALAGQRKALGPTHSDTLTTMNVLANAITANNPARAEALLRDAYKGLRSTRGVVDPDTIQAATNLAEMLLDRRHYAEAEQVLRPIVDAKESRVADLGPGLIALARLGEVLLAQRRWNEAATTLTEAVDGLSKQNLLPSEREELETITKRLAQARLQTNPR